MTCAADEMCDFHLVWLGEWPRIEEVGSFLTKKILVLDNKNAQTLFGGGPYARIVNSSSTYDSFIAYIYSNITIWCIPWKMEFSKPQVWPFCNSSVAKPQDGLDYL